MEMRMATGLMEEAWRLEEGRSEGLAVLVWATVRAPAAKAFRQGCRAPVIRSFERFPIAFMAFSAPGGACWREPYHARFSMSSYYS